ncbi:MAG: hypothetical protein ACRDHE_16270 [Ktedonobacterales bacterium]
MQCPSCGLGLAGVTLAHCPRCGQPLLKPEAPAEQPVEVAAPAPRVRSPLAPLATVRPRWYGRSRLLAAVVAGLLVVVCAVSCGALYLINTHSKPATIEPLPGVTATLHGSLTYVSAFTSGVDNWAEDSNCHIRRDGYHVKNGYVCWAPLQNVFDVDVYVRVKLVSGPATRIVGVVFRGFDGNNFYSFGVNANGDWAAIVCVNSTCKPLAGFTRDTAVQAGIGATNALEVEVTGTSFTFFVNGAKVGEADDSSVGTGMVGLYAEQGAEASFTNLMIAQPSGGA